MHGLVRQRLEQSDEPYDLPAGEPLTLASYAAGPQIEVYLEHLAVGAVLPEMPLFLGQDRYVHVPLEATYHEAYRGRVDTLTLPRRPLMIIETTDSDKGVQAVLEQIEIDPRVCNGNPVVRGTRIPVAVILDHLAAGESWQSILNGFPELSREDIVAVLGFARHLVENTEIVPAQVS